jgi:hypothetical protein
MKSLWVQLERREHKNAQGVSRMHKLAQKLRSQPTRVKPHSESFLHDTEILHRFQGNEDGVLAIWVPTCNPKQTWSLEYGGVWQELQAFSKPSCVKQCFFCLYK